MAKVLCGNLALKIEIGHYRHIPREERLCQKCEQGSIENELHFLLDCEHYNDFRTELLNSVPLDNNMNNTQILNHLLTYDPRTLSNFIIKCWTLRNI